MVDFAIHVTACLACFEGNTDILHYLLEIKKSVVTAVDHRAYIVLFAAAEERPDPTVWTLLLDEVGYGSPPTKPGELNIGYAGSTASRLIMRVMPGAHEVVQVFINRGFRPQFYHMEQAAVRGSPESLLVLLSDILPRFPTGHFHNQYILQDTVSRDKLENAKILIEKAVVDINDVPTWQQAPEWYGDLPRPSPALQNAVHSSDMINMLMEHGARINVSNANGITPIEFARIYKCYEAEKLMLELAPPEDIPMSYRTMSSEAEK